jgi:hypothetical protein
MHSFVRFSVPVAMVIVLIASFSVPTYAAPVVGGYGTLTLVNPPTPSTCQGQRCYQVTFKNNLAASIVPALVFFVVHNSAGQTVLMSLATVNFDPSATSSAFPLVYGLGPGTYNATVFATNSGEVGISAPTFVTFTI